MSGLLVLEDGAVFPGECVGARGTVTGEAVFTTAMTGYQEVATDPSFAGQIVSFTAPMVGNYGVADHRDESSRPHAAGVVMREARGPEWTDWLTAHGMPALTGVDTRALTLHLREQGALRCALVTDGRPAGEAQALACHAPGMVGRSLAAAVSTPQTYVFASGGRADIAVVDYGVKRSILRRLAHRGASVTVLPHDVDADTLAGYDGVVLSNGPGDPDALDAEIAVIHELVGRVPILGICLGHQLLALATGLKTFKLPFGHRGANHPVLELKTRRVLVTSQNHGFAVAGATGAVTHESLYDGTIEGLSFPELRARSVQFHPEAGPGPHDAWSILDGWLAEVAGEELRAAA